LSDGVVEYVICGHAEALYDGDASAPVVDDAAVAAAAGNVVEVEFADGVTVAVDNTRADEATPAAPSSEPAEAQMNRRHELYQDPKVEHFPEPLEFQGQMELRLPVEFPKPSAPDRRMEVAPPMAVSMAAISLEGYPHSHRCGVLEIEKYYVPSPRAHWLEESRRYPPGLFRYCICQDTMDC
jgi:hypothetical protein